MTVGRTNSTGIRIPGTMVTVVPREATARLRVSPARGDRPKVVSTMQRWAERWGVRNDAEVGPVKVFVGHDPATFRTYIEATWEAVVVSPSLAGHRRMIAYALRRPRVPLVIPFTPRPHGLVLN